jgi:hypothetical protein
VPFLTCCRTLHPDQSGAAAATSQDSNDHNIISLNQQAESEFSDIDATSSAPPEYQPVSTGPSASNANGTLCLIANKSCLINGTSMSHVRKPAPAIFGLDMPESDIQSATSNRQSNNSGYSGRGKDIPDCQCFVHLDLFLSRKPPFRSSDVGWRPPVIHRWMQVDDLYIWAQNIAPPRAGLPQRIHTVFTLAARRAPNESEVFSAADTSD